MCSHSTITLFPHFGSLYAQRRKLNSPGTKSNLACRSGPKPLSHPCIRLDHYPKCARVTVPVLRRSLSRNLILAAPFASSTPPRAPSAAYLLHNHSDPSMSDHPAQDSHETQQESNFTSEYPDENQINERRYMVSRCTMPTPIMPAPSYQNPCKFHHHHHHHHHKTLLFDSRSIDASSTPLFRHSATFKRKNCSRFP